MQAGPGFTSRALASQAGISSSSQPPVHGDVPQVRVYTVRTRLHVICRPIRPRFEPGSAFRREADRRQAGKDYSHRVHSRAHALARPALSSQTLLSMFMLSFSWLIHALALALPLQPRPSPCSLPWSVKNQSVAAAFFFLAGFTPPDATSASSPRSSGEIAPAPLEREPPPHSEVDPRSDAMRGVWSRGVRVGARPTVATAGLGPDHPPRRGKMDDASARICEEEVHLRRVRCTVGSRTGPRRSSPCAGTLKIILRRLVGASPEHHNSLAGSSASASASSS